MKHNGALDHGTWLEQKERTQAWVPAPIFSSSLSLPHSEDHRRQRRTLVALEVEVEVEVEDGGSGDGGGGGWSTSSRQAHS